MSRGSHSRLEAKAEEGGTQDHESHTEAWTEHCSEMSWNKPWTCRIHVENLKIIMLTERSQEKRVLYDSIHIYIFYLYKIIENADEPMVTEGRSAWDCGG